MASWGIIIREVVSGGRAVWLRLGDDVSVVGFVCLFLEACLCCVYRNSPTLLGLIRSLQFLHAGGSLIRPVRWGRKPALPGRVWLRELRGTGGGKEQREKSADRSSSQSYLNPCHTGRGRAQKTD